MQIVLLAMPYISHPHSTIQVKPRFDRNNTVVTNAQFSEYTSKPYAKETADAAPPMSLLGKSRHLFLGVPFSPFFQALAPDL